MRCDAASNRSAVRRRPASARRRPPARPSPPRRPPSLSRRPPRRGRPAPPDTMELRGRTIALYGRFSPGVGDRLRAEIGRQRGLALRDLTRRSDLLVVGALATTLIDNEALPARLRTARERGVPVMSERAFLAELTGEAPPVSATLPLSTALGGAPLTRDDVEVLAAFDL